LIPVHRFLRFIFALALTPALALTSSAAASPRIIPLRTSMAFSAGSGQSRWSFPIKSTDGRTVYVLSLEPDEVFRAEPHRAEGLVLRLQRRRDKSEAPNLLAAIRNWHGMQDFMFPARDFKQGVKSSLYGEDRTIYVKNLGLVVQIKVSKATAHAISANGYLLDTLELKIEVDNLSP
jgi:hypothetical protein